MKSHTVTHFNNKLLDVTRELYNFRMVDSALIFKTFYLLITLSVTMVDKQQQQQQQQPGTEAFDPIENMFRIRLVCALLDTCGQ